MTNIIPFHAGTTPEASAAKISGSVVAQHGDISCRDHTMPAGYALFDDGIYLMSDNDGASSHVPICSPLRVDAIFSNRDGTGWGKIIAVRNADGGWQDVHVSNKELAGPSNRVLGRLIDCGLELAPSNKAKEHLLSMLKQWKPASRMITVGKLGWVDDAHGAFAMPDGAIGSGSILPMIPAAGLTSQLICKGTKDEWKQAIGVKCAGNPMMLLAVSLAFSGPMLSILGIASGGLHFRGSSSSGKTTLLQLAASVWGTPRIVTQWRATDNGLESIAPTLNDMLLPLDEIAGINAKQLHSSIYLLANGTGKGRMTKEAETWRLALISTGEISVAEKFKEEKLTQMAGQEVRLIDIEADAHRFGVFDILHGHSNGSGFSDELKHAAGQFYGAVGRAFVDYIITDRARLCPAITRTVRSIQAKALSGITVPVSGQVSRVAERFAIIGAAGEVAAKAGLTGWDRGCAMGAAISAFKEWYDRKHGERNSAAVEFAAPLKAFIAANINMLCEVGGAMPAGTVVGWKDATCIYLPLEVWAGIYPGLAGTEAAKVLIASNLLYPGEDNRIMKRSPREIPGRPRLFTVNIENLTQFVTK